MAAGDGGAACEFVELGQSQYLTSVISLFGRQLRTWRPGREHGDQLKPSRLVCCGLSRPRPVHGA
jgi:hypothetical protein